MNLEGKGSGVIEALSRCLPEAIEQIYKEPQNRMFNELSSIWKEAVVE